MTALGTAATKGVFGSAEPPENPQTAASPGEQIPGPILPLSPALPLQPEGEKETQGDGVGTGARRESWKCGSAGAPTPFPSAGGSREAGGASRSCERGFTADFQSGDTGESSLGELLGQPWGQKRPSAL